MLGASLYARVSTSDQQTLALQNRAMRECAARPGLDDCCAKVREVNSGAMRRETREKLEAARRRYWCGGSTLGPVGNGSADDSPGIGPSGCRLRFADRGSGPDHSSCSRHGRTADDSLRVRKGSPAGTDTGRLGACAAERERVGRPATAALHAAEIRKLHRAGHRQIRNRSTVVDRPNLSSSDFGATYFSEEYRPPRLPGLHLTASK